MAYSTKTGKGITTMHVIRIGTLLDLTGVGEEWLLDVTHTYVIAKFYNGNFDYKLQLAISQEDTPFVNFNIAA